MLEKIHFFFQGHVYVFMSKWMIFIYTYIAKIFMQYMYIYTIENISSLRKTSIFERSMSYIKFIDYIKITSCVKLLKFEY